VTSVKGYAQLVLRRQANRTLDAAQLTRYLQIVADAADRLDRLTYDLLDVARIRTGKLVFRFRAIDLARHLEGVVAEYRERLEDRHTFAVERWDASCEVTADAERIEQVLVNLLENAVKYSPDGGIVALSLAREDAGVRLSVRDEGIGLPAGAREAIFEPFTRAANAEERGLPGAGLGLSICRTIVERHGGRLWAESAGTDQGTRFVVWLPRSTQEQKLPAR
jgi:two-component system, OmpR family, sensor kinase